VFFGIIFLSKLKNSKQKSEFYTYFYNPIFLGIYSIITMLLFWPYIFIQLVTGTGWIFDNSRVANIVTTSIHFIVPVASFLLIAIFKKHEELQFKYFFKKYSYYILILPAAWLLFSYTRMAIYIYVHGFDRYDIFIVWFESYQMLNLFTSPWLTILLLIFGAIVFIGLGCALAYLIFYLQTRKYNFKKGWKKDEKRMKF